jgi:hypothetical protein
LMAAAQPRKVRLCSRTLCGLLEFLMDEGCWGWELGMERVAYEKWLEAIDTLSAAQRREVGLIVSGRSAEEEVIGALEGRLLADRVCPHCRTEGAMCRDAVRPSTR